MSKISILRGDFIHDKSSLYFDSLMKKYKVPWRRQELIPLHRLDDDAYWELLGAIGIDIGLIDPRHWLVDDITFKRYVRCISCCKMNALHISNDVFGSDWPKEIPFSLYESKFRDRIEILCDAVRNKSPDTQIISPSIRLVEEEYNSAYLDLLKDLRGMFSVWGVSADLVGDDKEIAVVSSFLSKILILSKKPVWVMRWAVPSGEEDIIHRRISPGFKLPKEISAAMRLRRIFDIIDDVSFGQAEWFFSGGGKDRYLPSGKTVEDHHWLDLNYEKYGWCPSHFMGILDYKGNPKKKVLAVLLDLIMEYA